MISLQAGGAEWEKTYSEETPISVGALHSMTGSQYMLWAPSRHGNIHE